MAREDGFGRGGSGGGAFSSRSAGPSGSQARSGRTAEAPSRAAAVLRWFARGWSVVSIVTIAAFLVGEGLHPGTMTGAELLGLLLFPVGVCAGMVLAWRRECAGGAVTVGSLAAFYAVHLVSAGTLPRGLAWLAFAAPGFLFLACALVDGRGGGTGPHGGNS